MRIATTLFEDLGQSDLVVLGKVVRHGRAGGSNYVEVEIAEQIYGRTDSATVSVIAHGPTANTGDAATVVAPAFTLGVAIGEHVLVFLKKASPDEFPVAGMKGNLHFVPLRKVDLRGLQDRQGYMAELKQLAEAVNVRDPTQREGIFLDLLSSHHDLITESAVKELGKLKSRKAMTALSRLAYVDNQRIRFQVIEAMREIGGQEAMAVIVSALHDESPRMRARAASILGWMRVREEKEKLIRIVLAKDEDEGVRSSAALALAYMEAKEAIPMLRDASNDETASTTLRETIRQALKQLERLP